MISYHDIGCGARPTPGPQKNFFFGVIEVFCVLKFWNEIFLNRVMKEEVNIGDTGTQKYRIKHGPNKGKVLG